VIRNNAIETPAFKGYGLSINYLESKTAAMVKVLLGLV